jgi:hypothetical protein
MPDGQDRLDVYVKPASHSPGGLSTTTVQTLDKKAKAHHERKENLFEQGIDVLFVLHGGGRS